MKVFVLCVLATVVVSDNFTPKLNNPITGGEFTYYDASGSGACGLPLTGCNAAVSASLFTPTSTWGPNAQGVYVLQDPVCEDKCVKIQYNGKTASFPITDKCPGCDANHVDLATKAFTVLEPNTAVGVAKDATITYVDCSSTTVSTC
ncbi:unnamed protein product [Bursaphelenchus okinawaensis]|uniref:Expansin-like protein n=1 Tax=Bursaphelenchus okinawaensis TaxID=465554 RepID=A0A811KAM7_9BILA|nr:unnamed protein product [Bursaphelenchus okinawaensis]CAG9096048.1 unnamed protein product [Bursaphelenchus okinawaensis]